MCNLQHAIIRKFFYCWPWNNLLIKVITSWVIHSENSQNLNEAHNEAPLYCIFFFFFFSVIVILWCCWSFSAMLSCSWSIDTSIVIIQTMWALKVLALLIASAAAGPIAEPRTGIVFPEALKGAKLSKLGVRTKGPIKVPSILLFFDSRGRVRTNYLSLGGVL